MTIIGKPDCHLCDQARAVVEQVCAELGESFVQLSILDDPELADQYWERIPVILVDGRPHDFWRVNAQRLRQALAEAPPDQMRV